MTEERLQHLMQDALDDALSTQEQHELSNTLEADQVAAEAFDQQQRVDDFLNRPPMVRAPQRLAMTIMARIGTLAQEQQRRSRQVDELSEASMQLAIQLVTVATMPLLVGASWMLINAQADEEFMDEVITQVAGLLILTLDTMRVIIEEAEAIADDDPQTAMAMISLLPLTMLELVKAVLGESDDDDDTQTT